MSEKFGALMSQYELQMQRVMHLYVEKGLNNNKV